MGVRIPPSRRLDPLGRRVGSRFDCDQGTWPSVRSAHLRSGVSRDGREDGMAPSLLQGREPGSNPGRPLVTVAQQAEPRSHLQTQGSSPCRLPLPLKSDGRAPVLQTGRCRFDSYQRYMGSLIRLGWGSVIAIWLTYFFFVKIEQMLWIAVAYTIFMVLMTIGEWNYGRRGGNGGL